MCNAGFLRHKNIRKLHKMFCKDILHPKRNPTAILQEVSPPAARHCRISLMCVVYNTMRITEMVVFQLMDEGKLLFQDIEHRFDSC